MRRRHFLELLAAGSFVASAPLAQEVVPTPPQMVLLTIAGIDSSTRADSLGAVLSTLVVREVPVNLVIDTQNPATLMEANSEIAQLLRHYAQSFPGLVEIIAWGPDLGRMTPYRAARQAHEERKALYAALFPVDVAGTPMRPVQSIACLAPLDSNAASAAMSAGFRCVLELPIRGGDFRETPVRKAARLDRLGLLSLLGGEAAQFSSAAMTLSRPASDLRRHLVFDASELANLSKDRLSGEAQEVARLFDHGALALSMNPMLAGDVQMRSETTYRRRIAVHVLGALDGTDEETETALFDLLTAHDIPFSRGPKPKGFGAAQNTELAYWVPLYLPSKAVFDLEIPFEVAPAEQLGFAIRGAVQPGDSRFGIVARLVDNRGHAGLNQDAELAIPLLALAGTPTEPLLAGLELRTQGDGVVIVIALAFRDAVSRAALVMAIQKALVQPDIRLMPLQSYCAEILPNEPLLPMLLLARAKGLQPLASPNPLEEDERAALLQDARAAWGYFETNSVAQTGLCPATAVASGPPGAGFLAVSMWEVGSHLNALMAALDLGILSDKDFLQRVARILETLARGSRKRLVLPPETIDALSGKATTSFNSFDSGRLMIALHRLAAHRLAPEGITKLVTSWNFAEVIRNKRLHSYRNRTLIDDFRSNYTHYAVSGMRAWGLDVASPLDGLSELVSADAQERLLALTSSFGILAAEPCFLHLLELSDSPSSAFLADCVDTLQRRLAIETGQVSAPSESPLDKSPWFTYQGFDIRRLNDPWRVEFGAKSTNSEWQGKLESLKATSTKAAYLWHALRPNDLSLGLLRSIRLAARHDTGFDSAVYLSSQTSSQRYSDLNTNAVILQTVAHMLK